MTANLDAAADRFRLAGELTEAEIDDLQIPSVAESQRNKKPKSQRLLHQQRATIMNSVDCIAKYKNHYVSKEIEAAQKLMAKHERYAARDATREAIQAEKDRFANLSKEEKTTERKAKRAANAATKAALVAASCHYAMSPADAIDDEDSDDGELSLFKENEIFNLDKYSVSNL